MILHIRGAKTDIAKKITPYFPPHKTYMEPFFGAGGMFFNKPKAQYNLLNDIDSEVFNVFMVIVNDRKKLEAFIKEIPIHSDLLSYWKLNEETDIIKKAARFLFLSNCSLYGDQGTLLTRHNQNITKVMIDNIYLSYKYLYGCTFTNWDFRKFIAKISFHPNNLKKELSETFIYADPPYLETRGIYSDHFTKQDSLDLFDCLENKGCKWAMSEFDNPFILKQAKKRNLNVIEIGERGNIKNKRMEILITNYKNNLKPMF